MLHWRYANSRAITAAPRLASWYWGGKKKKRKKSTKEMLLKVCKMTLKTGCQKWDIKCVCFQAVMRTPNFQSEFYLKPLKLGRDWNKNMTEMRTQDHAGTGTMPRRSPARAWWACGGLVFSFPPGAPRDAAMSTDPPLPFFIALIN